MNFDVNSLTGATGNTLAFSPALTFAASLNQTINVTGNSTYTLGLGNIVLTATSHNPYFALTVNTLPTGAGVTINSVTAGNYGSYLNLAGGGNVTVTGNLANASNGSLNLVVNNGTTVTLQGTTVKTGTLDAYRYLVPNGTLVLDNGGALLNNTTGTGLNTSYFILGAATNVFGLAGTFSASPGVLVTANNSFNAAVYLGDTNNLTGGLTTPANLTNYVSDGDIGITNSGIFTIGGQNTSGVNTYANPIILGLTPNQGKSVTLVAATGGEVDFTGGIWANGTDTTAGVTVGNATFDGLVKLTGANTYRGATIINKGTLALANNGVADGSIASSACLVINSGTTLDVSGESTGSFPLGTGAVAQTLRGSGSVNGTLTVGALGTVAPGSTAATGILTVSNNVTLGGITLMKLNNTSSPTSDELVSPAITAGGTLTVTNLGPALQAGNTFQLFNQAVSGFAQVNLPLVDQNNYRYTWNNQLANNGTIVVLTARPNVNTNAATANFKAVVAANGSLQFNWAPDHQGWQIYTNAVGLAASGSWFPVSGSANGTNATININPALPNVFFQLRYP